RHIDRNIANYNGKENGTASIDAMDRLLDEQAYRLCHWRAAFDEINYRRFFDINELAAISMEAPDVFWRSHGLVRSLLAEGSLSGLRIDHIDGLFDPERYLLRLQWAYLADLGQLAFKRLCAEASAAALSAEPGSEVTSASNHAEVGWHQVAAEVLRLSCEQFGLPAPGPEDLRAILGPETVAFVSSTETTEPKPALVMAAVQPLYVLTEKILGPDEPLPETWPIAGTTGYDFLTTLTGMFVQPLGWEEIVRGYKRFTDMDAAYEQVLQESKRLILRVAMSSELLMLAHRLNRLSEQHRRSRDL